MTSNASTANLQNNKQPLLTISIVTFNPDFDELKKHWTAYETRSERSGLGLSR